jgi:hypothetical protein
LEVTRDGAAGALPDPRQGRPGPLLVGLVDDLQVASDERGQTTIAGPVVDQAALHGLLAKVRDLGLELLEVRRSDPD